VRSDPLGEFHCFAERSSVVDHADLVVLDPEDLIPLLVVGAASWPPDELDDDEVFAVLYNLNARAHARVDDELAVFEDRPGLIGAVSRRRVSPPEVAALNASPVKVWMKQPNQGIEVAVYRGVEGGSNVRWL
jgi:hypothetical protein